MPVKNWMFGAYAPVSNAELMEQQILLSHNYRNKLVELELQRRDGFDKTLRRLSTDYDQAANARDIASEEIEQIYGSLRIASKRAGKRIEPTPDVAAKLDDVKKRFKEAITAIDKAKKSAIKELKRVVDKVKADTVAKIPEPSYAGMTELEASNAKRQWQIKLKQAWLPLLEKHGLDGGEAAHRFAVNEARGESGLYWGNYGYVEESMQNAGKGLPPRYRRNDGTGAISVQLQQRTGKDGFRRWQDLVAGKNTYAQVVMPKPLDRSKPIGVRHDNKKNLAYLKIRVGTGEKRSPIFVVVPFVLSRVPDDMAEVSRVTVHKKRVGPDFEYSVRFTIDIQDPENVEKGVSPISLYPNARVMGNGMVRFATAYVGGENVEEYFMSQKDVGCLSHLDHLQSTRNKVADEAIAWFAKESEIIRWNNDKLTQEIEYCSRWRTPERLLAFREMWLASTVDRDPIQLAGPGHPFVKWVESLKERPIVQKQRNPFATDTVQGVMEGWYRWDLHMFRWHSNLSRKVVARRDITYRRLINDLRKKYGIVIMPKVDYRENIDAKSTSPAAVLQRRYRRFAALGELTRWCQEKFGSDFVSIDPPTNVVCMHCLTENKPDKTATTIFCDKCRSLLDQDKCLAVSQLAKWSETLVNS